MNNNKDCISDDIFKCPKKTNDCIADLREALKKAMRKSIEIEVLTAATPPAGRPPNITGVIKGFLKYSLVYNLRDSSLLGQGSRV